MKDLPQIMVAPNGARRGKADHPALPVTIAETVQTALACYRAGARGLHAHLRDDNGQHILDSGRYRELLSEMAQAVPDMLVQITTESVGRYTPAQQRAIVKAVEPVSVSVSLREMLADGADDGLRRFYFDAADAGIAVQHILYDIADINRFGALRRSRFLPAITPQVLLVLGRYDQDSASQPDDLALPLAALRKAAPEADWAVCAFGARETDCLAAAARAGGKVRVGFENNLLNADGTVARDNAERVAEVFAALHPQDKSRKTVESPGPAR